MTVPVFLLSHFLAAAVEHVEKKHVELEMDKAGQVVVEMLALMINRLGGIRPTIMRV